MKYSEHKKHGLKKGTIKAFDPYNGCGFVVDSLGREVFFHENVIPDRFQRYPKKGKRVYFHDSLEPENCRAVYMEVV